MRERSSHRARNEDICSSSTEDETPVQHKNAKKAHRERRTRSKRAKRAKIALIATHDMSATKKIFELNHGGKTRLTEILETVSCNCTFARGSDLCLHIIWVLMNVLKVNEQDKMLHQKAHSAENVLKMFSNCQPNNVAILPSTSTGIASRPPLPGPSQTGPSGISNATRTTSRPPTPGPTSTHGSVPVHRPPVNVPHPTPKVGQYILTSLQYCHPNVEKCFGCQGALRNQNVTPPPPEDLVVVGMMPRQYIVGGTSRLKMSNAYFHANEGCIRCRLPNFSSTLVDIQPGLPPLSHADKTFLLGNLNLSI